MKLAALFVMAALFSVPAIQAQGQGTIKPGDILVLKMLSKWPGATKTIAVAVTPDGKIFVPVIVAQPQQDLGTKANEYLSVVGLGLDEAAQKLQQRYETPKLKGRISVIIERGTIDQLLR